MFYHWAVRRHAGHPPYQRYSFVNYPHNSGEGSRDPRQNLNAEEYSDRMSSAALALTFKTYGVKIDSKYRRHWEF